MSHLDLLLCIGEKFASGKDDKLGFPRWLSGLGQEDPLETGNSIQYSCLRNPMDRGAWQVTVHGVPKSRTRLSD